MREPKEPAIILFLCLFLVIGLILVNTQPTKAYEPFIFRYHCEDQVGWERVPSNMYSKGFFRVAIMKDSTFYGTGLFMHEDGFYRIVTEDGIIKTNSWSCHECKKK